MKNLLICSSFTRVAVIIVAMASMASNLNVGVKRVMARGILMFIGLLICGNITAATLPEVNFGLFATYTNPEIVEGPLSFGLISLPSEVNATFQFSAPLPESGEYISPSITSASLTFGNVDLTVADLYTSNDDVGPYPIFTFSLDSARDIDSLQYGFLFSNTLVAEGIVLNSSFEMNIKGTVIETGEFFHYKYTTSSQTLTQDHVVVEVNIDIKPGSDPNCFNINGHGVVPVAILGSAVFDVNNVDVDTLSFAELEVRIRGNKGPLCSYEDVNGDGFLDMVCHFEDNADNWAPGDGVAELSGELLDGTSFKGTDSICVVGDDGTPPTPKTASVLNISFDPFFINRVDFVVETPWLSDPDLALDISITGLNGEFRLHGEQVVPLAGMTVIAGDASLTQVSTEWTDPATVVSGEVITVCVTVVRLPGETPEGPESCFDFGPF
jgi:hypothetical protein